MHGLVIPNNSLKEVIRRAPFPLFVSPAYLKKGTSYDKGCLHTRRMLRTTGGRHAVACHKYHYVDVCVRRIGYPSDVTNLLQVALRHP